MDYYTEKIAYLKGLADGLDIKNSDKQGKVLLNIISTLGDFAEAIDDLYEGQNELSEYVDYIDEDLAEVEDDIYEDEHEFIDEYEDIDEE